MRLFSRITATYSRTVQDSISLTIDIIFCLCLTTPFFFASSYSLMTLSSTGKAKAAHNPSSMPTGVGIVLQFFQLVFCRIHHRGTQSLHFSFFFLYLSPPPFLRLFHCRELLPVPLRTYPR